MGLFIVLLLSGLLVVTTGSGGSSLPLYSTGSSTSQGRVEGVVEVLHAKVSTVTDNLRRETHLLGVESNNERGNVDHLLSDSDVPLSDQDSGVVHALGQTALEDLGLQSSLHEILGLQGQDVIESHTGVIEHTDSDQSSDQGVTLEESLGVLVVELEQFSGGSSDLRGGG
jgi:hypothetical protein